MKIDNIFVSVFELPSNTVPFNLVEEDDGTSPRWLRQGGDQSLEQVHLLHVKTDEGVEGICTVGDARYPTMRAEDLAQLRILATGEDPFDRERLFHKLHAATRGMFTRPGWFGAFDNCLWDMAGKVAGLPVYALIGRSRERCPAYYNFGGKTIEECIEDAQSAVAAGFLSVKDHFAHRAETNIKWFEAMRKTVGPDIDLLHDAAGCRYTLEEAIRVGRVLEELRFGWFEEPLPDRDQIGLQKLCTMLSIPILAPESLMHDLELSALWLIRGATSWIRANARLGTTAILKLAHLAEMHRARIEWSGGALWIGSCASCLCFGQYNVL
ncbi:hypothetical protein KFU94_48840 [Chloroflexi bacterium TSY]|nr:hypothetical protein [Chloroflexi bacterium TSY]